MKVLISGDPHGKVSSLDVFKRYLDWLIELVETEKPDCVVILGDLFDTHAIIRSEVLNEWLRYFGDYRVRKVKHILIKGNHDEAAPGSSIHALAALRCFENVVVVDGLFENELGMFVPYCPTVDAFAEYLEGEDLQGKTLWCHQTFDGAKYDNGFYAPDGIPVSLVRECKNIISGHVHKAQNFAHIWYPGSPYGMNFNDANEEKGVYFLDTETSDVRFVSSPLPRFFTVEVAVDDVVSFFEGKDSTHRYKLVVNGTRPAISTLQASPEFAKIKKAFSITMVPHYVEITPVTNHVLSELKSDREILSDFITDIFKSSVDQNELLKKCEELLS